MTTTTKGDPIVGKITTTDRRMVMIDLANGARTDNGTGATFIPDRLWLEFTNCELTQCAMTGRRLRADGLPFLDGRRTGREFLARFQRPFRLDRDTPEWVKEAIEAHRPA